MVEVSMPEDSDLPPDVVAKLHSLPPISIYRLLAIVPSSVTPWADLVGAIYDCELPDRLREIGICRQAGPHVPSTSCSSTVRLPATSASRRTTATELILTLSVYAAVARFTNATRAPIEADNPLATAANPNG